MPVLISRYTLLITQIDMSRAFGQMDKFSELLTQHFNASIPEDFDRRASYNRKMDFLEYVSEDTTVIAVRIDRFLTLLLAADDRSLVGFRLKGFGYAFKTHIQPVMKLTQDDFDPIIFFLNRFFTEVGNSLTGDDGLQSAQREEAYREVVKLAKRDQVSLPPELAAAA